jgi:hypothetical protein
LSDENVTDFIETETENENEKKENEIENNYLKTESNIAFVAKNAFRPSTSFGGQCVSFDSLESVHSLQSASWATEIKKTFRYERYQAKNDLIYFLRYWNIPLCKRLFKNHYDLAKLDVSGILRTTNFFDIDLFFFCKVNRLPYENKKQVLQQMNGIQTLLGKIYHPKQLKNLFGKLEIFRFLDELFVFFQKKLFPIHQFVSTFVYSLTFPSFCKLLITQKYDFLHTPFPTSKFVANSAVKDPSPSPSAPPFPALLVLVFIGNEKVGEDLLQKLASFQDTFYSDAPFHLGVCFSPSVSFRGSLKDCITKHFPFFAIYSCKEMGNDIGPTLLMYKDICDKRNIYSHILKFHTKSIEEDYLNLTDFLLAQSVETLLQREHAFFPAQSNCLGHPNYYHQIMQDAYNNELKHRYIDTINQNAFFVGGTIFYTPAFVFDDMLAFLKSHQYPWFFLNSMYENNMINHDGSPTHFLERLFGVIKKTKNSNDANSQQSVPKSANTISVLLRSGTVTSICSIGFKR